MVNDDVHSPSSSTFTQTIPNKNIERAILNKKSAANVSCISMSTTPHTIKEYNAILMLTTEGELESLLRYRLVTDGT